MITFRLRETPTIRRGTLPRIRLARLVRCLEAQQRYVSVSWVVDNFAVRRGDILGDALEIDPPALPERQDLIMVGQQCVRPALGVRAGSDELGLADRGRCLVQIDVRVVEKPEDELLPQSRRTETSMRSSADPALLHELHDELGPGLAAELIAAGIQDHLYARQLI